MEDVQDSIEEVRFGGRKGWSVSFLDSSKTIFAAEDCSCSGDTVRTDEDFDETDMPMRSKKGGTGYICTAR